MRIPKWLHITMIAACLFLTIGYAGWWWITWPDRTLDELAGAAEHGDLSRLKALIVGATCTGPDDQDLEIKVRDYDETVTMKLDPDWQRVVFCAEATTRKPRDATDILFARRQCSSRFHPHASLQFSAERGRTRLETISETLKIVVDR